MNYLLFPNKTKRAFQAAILLMILLVNFGPASTRVAFAAPPANDNFASATVIGSIPYTSNISTTEATAEAGAPVVNTMCDGKLLRAGHKTVWYRYTPAANEQISLDTLGSDYDTYIAVWTGSAGNLTIAACDDDTIANLQSHIEMSVTAGVTYHIEVAQFSCSQDPNCISEVPTGGNLRFHVNYPNTEVTIGGALKGSYYILPGQRVSPRYMMNGGPVHVESTDGVTPIFTSQRAIFRNSFNSIIGYPGDQLTTEYWFTSYDDVGLMTFLVIGNPDPVQTAEVDVYIGGALKEHRSIAPGQRVFPRYGVNGGPVRVVSTNGVPIFTSERARLGDSFNEVMGYPGNQVHTEFWFTSYDDVGMITYLVMGNPSTSQTAEVDVYIGGVKRTTTPLQIGPGQRIFRRYGINGGPVRVVSTNSVDIFASERTRFGNTFNEVLGYPGDQVHTEFWFTSYDDVGMSTFLIVGNPSTSQTAEVDVYIGGSKVNPDPYLIAPGQRMFRRYTVNGGPVRVVSINGVNIFASERSRYLQSFNEILGVATNQLATDYWFTSYDDVGMSTFLIIGTP